MSGVSWTRPDSLLYPSTWHSFPGTKSAEDGKVPNFRIQDITDDMHEEVIELLLTHFIADSPVPKELELLKDPVAADYMREYCKKLISQNISLVAVVDDITKGAKPRIAGINVMYVCTKNEKLLSKNIESKKLKIWFEVLDFMYKKFDPYEVYQVNRFLRGRMFLVLPEFRRQGIGLELLKTGLHVGKLLGFNFMVTIFTNTSAQKIAASAGFKLELEICLEDFELDGKKYFSDMEDKYSKLMVARMD